MSRTSPKARELVRGLLLQTSAAGGIGATLSVIDTINARVAAAYEDQLARQRRADVEFGRRAAKTNAGRAARSAAT
jgi:hypothetical protein